MHYSNFKKSMSKVVASLLLSTQLLSPLTTLAQEVELLDEKPAVAEVVLSDAPDRIMASLTEDSSTSMAFNWYAGSDLADAKVLVSLNEDLSEPMEFEAVGTEVTNEYLEKDENGFIIFEDVAYTEEGELELDEAGNPVINGYYTDENLEVDPSWTSGGGIGQAHTQEVTEYSYKAEATGLEPNTTYYYQVGSETGGFSETGTFTTAGEAGEAFTYIHYTDTQNAYWNENVFNEADFGADTLAQAIDFVGGENLDFVFHTGDFVETAQVEDEWVDIINKSAESFKQFPLASVAGNHDEYSMGMYGEYLPPVVEKFNEHVNVGTANDAISGGSYYSFDYNGVHFTVLNSNDNKESDDNPDGKAFGQAQLDWARQDIEEARANGAEWVILAYHKPVFSKSYHSLQDSDVQAVREEFISLVDELDADLAMQGHDHVVSATYPLNFVSTDENFSNAVVAEYETTDIDGVEFYVNPEATVFTVPNTGGTKTYDDVYSKGLEHLHNVRPRLEWMTEEDVEYYNSLFAYGNQPDQGEHFETSHSNARLSTVQNFAVVTIDGGTLLYTIYQISGNVLEGEERTIEKVYEFGITKDGAAEEAGEEVEESVEETVEESAEESVESTEEGSEESSEESEESTEESSEETEESTEESTEEESAE